MYYRLRYPSLFKQLKLAPPLAAATLKLCTHNASEIIIQLYNVCVDHSAERLGLHLHLYSHVNTFVLLPKEVIECLTFTSKKLESIITRHFYLRDLKRHPLTPITCYDSLQ